MTTTLESANDALRSAVRERLNNTPKDDPKIIGYQPDDFADFLHEPCCEGQRLRGDSLLREDRPLGSVEWLEAVEQLRELHFEKTAQYGDTDPFANVTASAKCGVEPWRRALCDLSDCVVRMQRYANGQPVDYENALMDAANWALICLVKLREVK